MPVLKSCTLTISLYSKCSISTSTLGLKDVYKLPKISFNAFLDVFLDAVLSLLNNVVK